METYVFIGILVLILIATAGIAFGIIFYQKYNKSKISTPQDDSKEFDKLVQAETDSAPTVPVDTTVCAPCPTMTPLKCPTSSTFTSGVREEEYLNEINRLRDLNLEVQDRLVGLADENKKLQSNQFTLDDCPPCQLTMEQALKQCPKTECPPCQSNFQSTCPRGWTHTGDGVTCLMPKSYTGPCTTHGARNLPPFMYIANYTDPQKRQWEKACRATW